MGFHPRVCGYAHAHKNILETKSARSKVMSRGLAAKGTDSTLTIIGTNIFYENNRHIFQE